MIDRPSRPLPIRPELRVYGLLAESALSTPLGVFRGRFGRVSLFETCQPVCRHAHAQFNVIIKVAGADETYEVDGAGPCPLTGDRLILLDPWTPHANRRSAVAGKAVLLSLYLEPSWLRAPDGQPVSRMLFAEPSAAVTAEVRTVATRLTHMLTAPDPVSGEHLEAALQDAFAAVVGTYGSGAVLPAPLPTLDGRIRRAVALMTRDAPAGVDIDAVCRAVGLSRTRFYDRFRASLGVSPRLFADGLRLDAAIGMLAHSRRPIGDISGRLGFSAQSQFTRFFREKTGFSPGAYRRSLSGM